MHLRAYTLQTVFFYPGKSLYGKTLLSPNAKLFLPLAMGKVFSFELPGNSLLAIFISYLWDIQMAKYFS